MVLSIKPLDLNEHYTALEVAKRHLWHTLFAEVFEHARRLSDSFGKHWI